MKLFTAIFIACILGACTHPQPKPTNRLAEIGKGLDEYALRGNIADYEVVEKKFIEAARNGDDAEIYALMSPLTKKDSSEKEVKLFAEAIKEYFREYESDLKCKSILPKKDEYGNVGFLFFNAFKRKNGGGRAYVIALIKENDTVYVSTVLRKFDPEFHGRCRNNL